MVVLKERGVVHGRSMTNGVVGSRTIKMNLRVMIRLVRKSVYRKAYSEGKVDGGRGHQHQEWSVEIEMEWR